MVVQSTFRRVKSNSLSTANSSVQISAPGSARSIFTDGFIGTNQNDNGSINVPSDFDFTTSSEDEDVRQALAMAGMSYDRIPRSRRSASASASQPVVKQVESQTQSRCPAGSDRVSPLAEYACPNSSSPKRSSLVSNSPRKSLNLSVRFNEEVSEEEGNEDCDRELDVNDFECPDYDDELGMPLTGSVSPLSYEEGLNNADNDEEDYHTSSGTIFGIINQSVEDAARDIDYFDPMILTAQKGFESLTGAVVDGMSKVVEEVVSPTKAKSDSEPEQEDTKEESEPVWKKNNLGDKVVSRSRCKERSAEIIWQRAKSPRSSPMAKMYEDFKDSVSEEEEIQQYNEELNVKEEVTLDEIPVLTGSVSETLQEDKHDKPVVLGEPIQSDQVMDSSPNRASEVVKSVANAFSAFTFYEPEETTDNAVVLDTQGNYGEKRIISAFLNETDSDNDPLVNTGNLKIVETDKPPRSPSPGFFNTSKSPKQQSPKPSPQPVKRILEDLHEPVIPVTLPPDASKTSEEDLYLKLATTIGVNGDKTLLDEIKDGGLLDNLSQVDDYCSEDELDDDELEAKLLREMGVVKKEEEGGSSSSTTAPALEEEIGLPAAPVEKSPSFKKAATKNIHGKPKVPQVVPEDLLHESEEEGSELDHTAFKNCTAQENESASNPPDVDDYVNNNNKSESPPLDDILAGNLDNISIPDDISKLNVEEQDALRQLFCELRDQTAKEMMQRDLEQMREQSIEEQKKSATSNSPASKGKRSTLRGSRPNNSSKSPYNLHHDHSLTDIPETMPVITQPKREKHAYKNQSTAAQSSRRKLALEELQILREKGLSGLEEIRENAWINKTRGLTGEFGFSNSHSSFNPPKRNYGGIVRPLKKRETRKGGSSPKRKTKFLHEEEEENPFAEVMNKIHTNANRVTNSSSADSGISSSGSTSISMFGSRLDNKGRTTRSSAPAVVEDFSNSGNTRRSKPALSNVARKALEVLHQEKRGRHPVKRKAFGSGSDNVSFLYYSEKEEGEEENSEDLSSGLELDELQLEDLAYASASQSNSASSKHNDASNSEPMSSGDELIREMVRDLMGSSDGSSSEEEQYTHKT